jgi:MSHA biogenesis protein MshK
VLLALFLPAMAAADDGERRDPLKPPGEVRSTPATTFNADAWRLVSTLVADGRRVAIINDRAVRVGDRVGGARVIAIEPGRVSLDYRGRRFTVGRPAAGVSKR